MAGSAKLSVVIVGDAASAKRAFQETGTAAEESGGKVAKAGESMKGMAIDTIKTFAPFAAGLGVAEFAKGAIEGAEKLEMANRSLETALNAVGGGAAKLLPQFKATAAAAAQFGINQTQATQSLSRAVLITHNAQAAQRAYNEAVVISKATGKDLNAVLLATAKAQDGSTGSLSRYGVVLKKGADGQTQFNAVMGAFKGQAEANTSASEKLSANFDNLQAKVGAVLLPAFDAVIGALNDIVNFLSSPQVAAAVSGFADTIESYLQPVIQWVQANWPQIKQTIETVLHDVEAVVKTVLGGLEAFWRTWGGTILTIVKNDLGAVKSIFQGLVDELKGVFNIIDGLIHGRWQQVWDGAKEIVLGALTALEAVVTTPLKNLAAIFGKAGSIIVHALGAGMQAALGFVKAALNAAVIAPINEAIALANQAIDAFDAIAGKIPFIGGSLKIPHIPSIPTLDTGGVVAETGLAVVHRGEVFSGVGPNAQGLGGGITIMPGAITVHGTADAAFARTLATELARQLRGGRVPSLASAISTVGG
jgi:phage-related protein